MKPFNCKCKSFLSTSLSNYNKLCRYQLQNTDQNGCWLPHGHGKHCHHCQSAGKIVEDTIFCHFLIFHSIALSYGNQVRLPDFHHVYFSVFTDNFAMDSKLIPTQRSSEKTETESPISGRFSHKRTDSRFSRKCLLQKI